MGKKRREEMRAEGKKRNEDIPNPDGCKRDGAAEGNRVRGLERIKKCADLENSDSIPARGGGGGGGILTIQWTLYDART